LASYWATKRLIKQIRLLKPDVIHLHNIHGYYINYKLLFEYLNSTDTPVVWTLHDCWAFTGHCAHYIDVGCEQWRVGCKGCKSLKSYPKSILNRLQRNYKIKKTLFLSLGERLTLVPVSKWLALQTEESFFKRSSIRYIYNGIDINTFVATKVSAVYEKYSLKEKKLIISVASVWSESKGFSEFFKLRKKLSDKYVIMLVGVSEEQIKKLPQGIIGIQRTQMQQELAELYSAAEIVLSLSRAETFGLTIVEGMACGTPAIVYERTALPELITDTTGVVVKNVGDIDSVCAAIETIAQNGKDYYSAACRKRAEEYFDKDKCFNQYLELYRELLKNK
jgi:glycosyltransferase involved in cell wall biosynthesis